MKLKKRVIPMLAGLLAALIAVTSTASAHPDDYFVGRYKGLLSSSRIILLIENSALTNYLTKEAVYDGALNWNKISSKVNVSVVCYAPGMPTLAGQVEVIGDRLKNGVLGRTMPYDANGNLYETNAGFNSDWTYVHIEINTDPLVFTGSTISTSRIVTNARKTFMHEVGHVLKLSHPKQDSELDKHTIDGLPYAIMNQGYADPNSTAVSANITDHDKSCLIKKWGK